MPELNENQNTPTQETREGQTPQGGSAAEFNENDPRIKEIIEKANAGIVRNRDEILAEKKTLADRVKILDSLGGEEGVKSLQEMQKRMMEDEDLKLFSQGKREEYNDRIVGRMKSDYDKKLEGRDKRISELENHVQEKVSQIERLVIDGQIREAAEKSGIVPSAIEDVIYRGGRLFSLDEENSAVAREQSGGLVNGKDGKPLTIAEWVDSMKEAAPHWWPPSAGGGALGGKIGSISEGQKMKEQYDKLIASGNIQGAVALKNQMHAQQRRQ